jgi:hypothetical protein
MDDAAEADFFLSASPDLGVEDLDTGPDTVDDLEDGITCETK